MNCFKFFLLVALVLSMPKLSFAEKVFFFKGQIDFSKNEFSIGLDLEEGSSLAAKAQRTSETDYRLSLDIEHLKTPLFDLLSKIEGSVEVVRRKDDSGETFGDTILSGKVWSQHSLVDYKPVRELSGRFEVKDQRLHLTALSIGNLTCTGYIDLVPPHKLDLVLHLFDIDMDNFLNFWVSDKGYESSGAISGEIKASGTLNHLALKGSLESRHGFVQKLDYDVISLNIEGVYPHMQIARSTISQSDGVSFMLDGPFNLSDKASFKKQIKALTIVPLVNDSGSGLEWTIKRLNPKDSGITEFKYRSQKGDALETGVWAGDEIDMLGVERTRKF